VGKVKNIADYRHAGTPPVFEDGWGWENVYFENNLWHIKCKNGKVIDLLMDGRSVASGQI
jgi:hypothetical protein